MTDHSQTYRLEFHQCAAKDCTRRATGFSRYCATHRGRYSRTGDPNGRILRKGRDLAEFRKMADTYLARWKDHPAIVKACEYLESLQVSGSTYTGPMRVHRDMARELRRLRLDGATGAAMLRKVVAVAAYAHWHRRTFDDGPCFTVNLGHHLLRTTARPGAGKVKRKVAFELGREVRETLGLLLSQVATAIEADITKQARAPAHPTQRNDPMNLHPELKLDATNTKRRERAAQFIEAMRHDLATLEHFTENADAETLRGNYWLEVLQEAELATKRALRTATHDGHSTINPREFCNG